MRELLRAIRTSSEAVKVTIQPFKGGSDDEKMVFKVETSGDFDDGKIKLEIELIES